jgi:hypothetical protein
MGADDHRSVACQARQHRLDLRSMLGIDSRRGLVEHEQPRSVDRRRCQHRPLVRAAGQRPERRTGDRSQIEVVDRLGDGVGSATRCNVEQPCRVRQAGGDGELGREAGALFEVTDRTSSSSETIAAAHTGTADLDRSRARVDQRRHHFQQRRFAASVRPDHGGDAVADAERHIVEHDAFAVTGSHRLEPNHVGGRGGSGLGRHRLSS